MTTHRFNPHPHRQPGDPNTGIVGYGKMVWHWVVLLVGVFVLVALVGIILALVLAIVTGLGAA